MEYENQTLETDPGVSGTENVSTSEGTQNDAGTQTAAPALTLEEINALTKHSYSSVDEARKGISNLTSLVGKKEVVKEVASPQLEQKVKELEFYLEHPDLKAHKDVISALGPNPYEVIKDPVKQKVLNAVKASEEKETLQSNPRINQPTSSADFDKDLESVKQTGDWVGFLKKHNGIDI